MNNIYWKQSTLPTATSNTKKFLGLSITEKLLVAKVFLLSGLFRAIILCIPFRLIAKRLSCHIKNNHTNKIHAPFTAQQIGSIIGSVCRHTPWESKCLVQALICKTLCRKYGIQNILHIGVYKNPETPDHKLESHAWMIDHNNEPIVGGTNNTCFKILATYSDTYDN